MSSKLSSPAAALAVLTTLILFSAYPTPARGGDDYTAFVYAGCSQARYEPGSQYAADVDTTLSSLINSAAYTSYANYTSPSTPQLAGVYQCRSDLPAAVCGACVKSAASKLSSLCNSASGAAVQLRACFVRYGNDSFLGKPDTTVLFKKCGGENAGDTGVVAMRDAALAALVNAAAAPVAGDGSYRAGAAGYVQAMAQCVGDLGAKACTDCVSAAASQLKAGCGYANAGEVYLGKCYARFWSNAGGSSSGGNGVPVGGGGGSGINNGVPVGGGGMGGAGNGYAYGGFVPNPYAQHDDSGKTLAIIIGLVAAVAIVIVLLSFVRRAGSSCFPCPF
ncbi:hypothetical protein HU200_021607 [Digitaria exilis]|uniref:Gnk2-homologous domain-containing protein n=1 Tax=Digitaria exilis TaxID=1010633 RepID=A0A835KB01_9POAL|nr:hypothetical protein HU200_021607 [Digitaria exilis]